jgi:hypothetical protein
MKIKVNLPVGQYKKDDVIEVETDSQGAPLDAFWRRRLNDAAIDNCVEIISDKVRKGIE